MILPLYFFTLVFVAGPLIYMVALSFAQPGSGTSVEWNLTLENYRKILDPVYLQTFRESFQLALTSTVWWDILSGILWQKCLIPGKKEPCFF